MPPFFVRVRRLLVPPLVITNDLAGVAKFRSSPAAAKDRRAALIQGPAHLFGRDLGIFPPAVVPYASLRIRARPRPTSDGVSIPDNRGLQNASGPLLVCPGGTSVP